MKIVVVGLGYVGLSNAVLLAQNNQVIGVDLSRDRIEALKAGKLPIVDPEISAYLSTKNLNLSFSCNLKIAVKNADYVIVSTPTNYDEKTSFFDTTSVEEVISQVTDFEPKACIVVKSTVPVGFIDEVSARLKTRAVMFSPEFLREGKALHDNLYPSRIIWVRNLDEPQFLQTCLRRARERKMWTFFLPARAKLKRLNYFRIHFWPCALRFSTSLIATHLLAT